MSSGRRKLCLALVLLALGVGLVSANKKSVSELDVYVKAAERAWAGESLNEPGEVKPFTYPPPFALPFLPFVPLPQWSLRSVFFLVNAGSLAAVVVLLRRRLLPVMGQADPPAPRERWLWILLLVLAGRSLASPLSNQSHDLLVFLCVALGVEASCRGRELSAGLAFAVGAACKATPGLFGLVLVWQRRWRAAGAMLAAIGLCFAVSELAIPREDGELRTRVWVDTYVRGQGVGAPADADGAWSAWNALNQNLAGSLYRLSRPAGDKPPGDVQVWEPSDSALRALTVGAQLAVVLLLLWLVRPSRAAAEDERARAWRRLGEGGAVVCAMVLLSPMSSKAHFCVLLLPLGYALASWLYRGRDAWLGALLLAVLITGPLTTKGLLGNELGSVVLARGAVAWSTLLALLATGRALSLRDPQRT